MDHFPIIQNSSLFSILVFYWLNSMFYSGSDLGWNTFVVSWAVWMCPLTFEWQPSLCINSSVPFWHSERFKNDPKRPPSVRQHVSGTDKYKFNEFWPHGTWIGWNLDNVWRPYTFGDRALSMIMWWRYFITFLMVNWILTNQPFRSIDLQFEADPALKLLYRLSSNPVLNIEVTN